MPPQFNSRKNGGKKMKTKYRGDAIFMGASNMRGGPYTSGFRGAVSCQGFNPV